MSVSSNLCAPVINSPLRWAGSKKKLLNELLFFFDKRKSVYIEPFLGSGVVLLNAIKQKLFDKYYVSDVNPGLITFFRMLQEEPEEIISGTKEISSKYNALHDNLDRQIFYNRIRDTYNNGCLRDLDRGVLFWFLMAGGFNGVYRTNSKGLFNVPYGKKEKIGIDEMHFKEVSSILCGVKFFCLDQKDFFRKIQETVRMSDCFIYCDPPYIPVSESMKNKTLYTKSEFNHRQFVFDLMRGPVADGSSIVISMSASKEADSIYKIMGFSRKGVNDIFRSVNPRKQYKAEEIIYLNYDFT